MKKRILAILLSVAMIVAMLPISSAVLANTYFQSDEFENLDMWENMTANYRMSTAPTIGTASSVTTYDGKTVLKPAVSQGRASGMTTIKAANFPTDKRVETITTKFRLPLENAMTAGQTNPDSSPGIYLLRINNYSGLAFQVTNYYNKKDTADTNNGTLNYQWIDVYYSEGALQNNKVVDCASTVSRKQTTTTADQWITATFTYDYSQIDSNKLTVNAVLTPADGSTPITTSYTKEFEAEGNNAYNEGFQIGIVAAGSANICAYFDSYAVEFEKTAADKANEFKTDNAYALGLSEINSSDDFDAVETAITEYEALGEDVKALLTAEIATLTSLMNDFDATGFKEDYAQVLALETVANNTQASQVLTAINAYAGLDDAVKALLTEEIATLNALKATIKITADDFEDEALFAEVWESLPETGDIQTTGSVLTTPTTQSASAQIVADSKDTENNVLSPEYRSSTRKRKILTLKDEYLDGRNIASFSTDLRVDAVCENVDRSPGIYFYYNDADNWARMEYQYDTTNAVLKVRLVVGSNASLESGKNEVSQTYPITGVSYGEWVNVKVDYVYTEEGTDLTFTFTGDTDTTVKTLSTDKFNAVKKVGYGAGANVADLMYFDNFALTYAAEEEEPVYEPTVDGATIKKSGTQDIQFSYTFGDLREGKEVAEYGMLLTLKAYGIADLTLGNTEAIEAGTIRTASSTEVAEVAKGAKFVASIGAVPESLYTYSYQTRVYVKYTDGTVDYSAIEERSVAGVAKSIAKWVLENKENITGLDETANTIEALVNTDGTLTETGKANNGEATLAYLETNNEVIAAAMTAAGL